MTKRAPLSFNADRVAPPAAATQESLPANTKTTKRAKEQKKTGREGRKFIAAHVIPEAHMQFSILAIQHGKDNQALLIEAINDCFAKYGLSRIA